MSEGYQPPSEKDYEKLLDYAKYETPEEGAKAFLQGAAKSLSGGLSTGLQIAAGDTPESIKKREEHHPGKSLAGEALPYLTPYGAPGLITKAGAGAAKALGLGAKGAGYINKLGSYAVKGAVEGALMAGTDEVSKAMSGTPGQTLGSAAAHMGMTGILTGTLSGAVGAAHPLWSSANEKLLGDVLGAFKDKANGVESAIEPLIRSSGMDIAPEMKAVLEGNPTFKRWYQTMMHGDTIGAKKLQDESKEFTKETVKEILKTINKDEAFLTSLHEFSVNDAGNAIKERMVRELEALKDKSDLLYKPINEALPNIIIPETIGPYGQVIESPLRDLERKFGEISEENGWNKISSSQEQKVINDYLPDIKLQKTADDLKKLASNIGNRTLGRNTPELWFVGGKLKSAVEDAYQNVLTRVVDKEAPLLSEQLKKANAYYAELKKLTQTLNEEFRVGKHSGIKSFISKFKELTGEEVFKRVSPKDNAAFLEKLSMEFPSSSELVKESYIQQALKYAKTDTEELLSPKKFFNKVFDGWTPEIRDFVLNKEVSQGVTQSQRLKAIQELVNKVPSNANPSGSAGMIQKLMKNTPAEVLAVISWLTGHGLGSGYVTAKLAKLVGTEGPDYAKVALLKFLGSDQPVNSAAFKAMSEFITSATKGQNKIINASKDLFKGGTGVIVSQATENEFKKTERDLQKMKSSPESFLDKSENLTHYLPDVGIEIGSLAGSALDIYQEGKPYPDSNLILDESVMPSKEKVAEYQRKLGLMNQPLRIFNYIKDSTITDQDREIIKKMYPGFYQTSAQALVNQVMDQKEKEKLIPYKLRLSLSKYLEMPLDSSITPQSVFMNQQSFGPLASLTQEEKQQIQKPTQGGLKALGKYPVQNQTALQARELHQVTKN